MSVLRFLDPRRLPFFAILAVLVLVAGCTGDNGMMAPSTESGGDTGGDTGGDDGGGDDGGGGGGLDPGPTHFEMSVKMSSINAQQDCENTPGNPGDFRYTLIVRKTDEFGNQVVIGSRSEAMTIGDGSVLGATTEPIRFLMPREPGATFQVEYRVGEYDGSTADFERHGWANHIWDRDDAQEWRAGTSYDTYHDGTSPGGQGGESYGILKFAVWNTRAECKGYARYIVRWTPVTP